ncbi:MAG: hypothetical protein CL529_12625 [Aequorivita sp.]|nr:hypothetical protein [Aequorivita sp.]|tara:strand:+ start:27166 stop:27357 length:192 start_codon:yes stop_codon:yes gene_type:complete
MAKKIKKNSTKPINPRKARRREQRRQFRKRFKAFFDGTPESDHDFYENGLEWMLEPHALMPEE